MSEVAWWQGSHGDEYTKRQREPFQPRLDLWADILKCFPRDPSTFLEIGAGAGNNIEAIKVLTGKKPIFAVEPNELARSWLLKSGFDAYDGTAANPGMKADLVFTSGVLIHIPPEELLESCRGIYEAAHRYIVCIEYFADEPEEKPYRGRQLWKRDFGSYWLDNFDLTPLGCGFVWKRMTGLDNLTWWIFKK
jgi:hypothetical protein